MLTKLACSLLHSESTKWPSSGHDAERYGPTSAEHSHRNPMTATPEPAPAQRQSCQESAAGPGLPDIRRQQETSMIAPFERLVIDQQRCSR
jgi:hypothetical protein